MPLQFWEGRCYRGVNDACAVPTASTPASFDRSNKTLFVNVQNAGGALRLDLTLAITRD